MKNDRRDFLRKLGVATGASIISGSPIAGLTQEKTIHNNTTQQYNLTQRVTILQTTDIHCQLVPHDELFWEDEKAVFRKTGGYAYLTTVLKELKKKNPNTYIIDTGDMFQGSELSVKTTGRAIVPILNAMPYDLYLPGNWEVVY